MNNVIKGDFNRIVRGINAGGEPPDNGDMEPRIAKLEAIAEKTSDRLAALERDVAVIKSNYSTKADVADAKTSIIQWVVGAIFLTQLLPALPGILRALGFLK